jgi:hypothetical protein
VNLTDYPHAKHLPKQEHKQTFIFNCLSGENVNRVSSMQEDQLWYKAKT